jgi:hypothetical protein
MSPPRKDEYFRLDRDGNGLREYARRFISTPGIHDGLYWPPENQSDISPLGGFAEDADLAGRSGEKPEPYNGYNFRILTAQGPAAPGGAFSYLINGHMIAGHAMIAWPATYGDSGVETFICGENGVVYQKDLGPNTAALGASMAQYNPEQAGRSSSSGDTTIASESLTVQVPEIAGLLLASGNTLRTQGRRSRHRTARYACAAEQQSS